MLRLGSQEAIYDDSLLELPSSSVDGLHSYEGNCRKEPSYYYVYRA